jgi:hypothetical protein
MLDRELLQDRKAHLADRFTAVELCELLNLTEWDLLEAFEERVMELSSEDLS